MKAGVRQADSYHIKVKQDDIINPETRADDMATNSGMFIVHPIILCLYLSISPPWPCFCNVWISRVFVLFIFLFLFSFFLTSWLSSSTSLTSSLSSSAFSFSSLFSSSYFTSFFVTVSARRTHTLRVDKSLVAEKSCNRWWCSVCHEWVFPCITRLGQATIGSTGQNKKIAPCVAYLLCLCRTHIPSFVS